MIRYALPKAERVAKGRAFYSGTARAVKPDFAWRNSELNSVPRPLDAAGVPGESTDAGSAAALEAIRALVRADLLAVDDAIRQGLKSIVPLVDQVAEHIIAGGGKRLRPLLVVLSGRACGTAAKGHIQAAAFIEFIHTATLLHDDVVDMSALRRGRDTANEVFGNQASVLVGDFVYSRAFQMMAAVHSDRVIEIMAEATNVIAEGEVLQLMNARDPDTTEQRYLEVIYRKTAKLFQAGAEVAAVVSGAERTVQQALARFGKHLGTAYQLIDDVLDYQSDPETLGKNLGDDLAEGKPTLPLIHALRVGDAAAVTMIRAAIKDGGREQLSAILRSIESTGGLQYTARLAQAEADQALAALSVLPDTPFRSGLAALTRFAINRKH
jgi:octaprenyl-diphosphate synthase